MNKLSKKIIQEIKKENIKPIPKWHFIAMNIALWSFIIFSIILGSLAIGIVLQELFSTEWQHIHLIGKNKFYGLLIVLPYMWFATLSITLIISYKLFKKTKKGYKYNPKLIIISSIIISIILGTIFYKCHTSDHFENMVRNNIRPYRKMCIQKQKQWVNPDKGVLKGVIIQVKKDSILIKDIKKQEWEIDTSSIKNTKLKNKDLILIIGKKTSKNKFHAKEIKTPKSIQFKRR